MILRIILLFFVLFVVEIYAFQVVRTLVKVKSILVSYQIISALLLAFIVYSFTQFDRSVGQTNQTMRTIGLLLLIYLPKIILTLVLLGEDVFRIGFGSMNHFVNIYPNHAFNHIRLNVGNSCERGCNNQYYDRL